MNRLAQLFFEIVHLQLKNDDIQTYTNDELRRIRMVNYIGLITLVTMLSYLFFYVLFDYSLFKPAILFLGACSILILVVMFITYRGFYSTGKVLVALANTVFMATTSTFIFGDVPGFQVFLLLSVFIPLFLWSFKQWGYLAIFISLNLVLYFLIEFFPPVENPLVHLPDDYSNYFRNTNVVVCFDGAWIAVGFYIVLANKKEQELVARTQELEQAKVHKDLVYSIIAHDLRSPFNGFLGLSEALNDRFEDFDDASREKTIGTMYATAKKVNGLLENLLEWSKFQSGTYRPVLQDFELRSIVDEVVDLQNEAFKLKKITVNNDVQESLKVFADEDMVSTIIRNLLNNAIKFTNNGGSIRISSAKTATGAEICIADSGIGIKEERLLELFDDHSTITTSGTNHEKGSGLGLKLCKDFIKANGGTIWAESKPKQGSKFFFTLNLK